MNRLKRSYKFFLLICAVAALWISIGSLVHFHQYKIFGHRLLSEVVISKRENEIPGCTDNDFIGTCDGFLSPVTSEDLQPAATLVSTLLTDESSILDICTGGSHSLRAPPAC